MIFMKKKANITISVPNTITQDEIKEIRKLFKNDPISEHYKLNILVSGNTNMRDTLANIILAKIM